MNKFKVLRFGFSSHRSQVLSQKFDTFYLFKIHDAIHHLEQLKLRKLQEVSSIERVSERQQQEKNVPTAPPPIVLGDTGKRLEQLIRDAEGNAIHWADVKNRAADVLVSSASR